MLSILMEFHKIFVVIFSSFLQNFLHTLRAFFKNPAHLSLSSKPFHFLRFFKNPAHLAHSSKSFRFLLFFKSTTHLTLSSKSLHFDSKSLHLPQNLYASRGAAAEIRVSASGTIRLTKGKSTNFLVWQILPWSVLSLISLALLLSICFSFLVVFLSKGTSNLALLTVQYMRKPLSYCLDCSYQQGWAKLVLIALERYSVALKRLTFNLR
jgi:hypothetical protein